MPARNDVTGDRIVSGKVTDNYRNNFDDIFNNKDNKCEDEDGDTHSSTGKCTASTSTALPPICEKEA